MALPAVSALSLAGLIARLQEVEHLKTVKAPDDEQAAILESEAAAKKAVAEELQAASSGVTSLDKKRAKEFLEGQLKSIDDSAKGAEARKTKLKELLAGIEAASSKDEPAHVRRAKQDLAKAEKAFEEVSKNYERWEKGKKMLSVDEIKTLKRSYEDGKAKIEKAKTLVHQQQCLKAQSAAAPLSEEKERGHAAMVVDARLGRGRGGGKASGRGAPPAVSSKAAGAAGGYPAAQPAGPSANAIRQAQMAAQVRAEAQAAAAEAAMAAPRPRPVARPKQQEEDVVLSYACTVSAVAEILGIKEAQARDMAESSKEFAQHFEPATWELVKERSVAIEKANREKQREAEKRKKEAALAKVTIQESSTAAAGGAAAAEKLAAKPKPAAKVAASRPIVGEAAPKPKPKAKSTNAGPKKQARPNAFEGLVGANRFGGFEDSDDEDDGWTAVKR